MNPGLTFVFNDAFWLADLEVFSGQSLETGALTV